MRELCVFDACEITSLERLQEVESHVVESCKERSFSWSLRVPCKRQPDSEMKRKSCNKETHKKFKLNGEL